MNFEDAKKELMNLQNKSSAYNHAVALIYYDGVTGAPKGTAENRANTLSVISEEMYKISTSPETVQLLEYLDSCIHPAASGAASGSQPNSSMSSSVSNIAATTAAAGASYPEGFDPASFDPESDEGRKLDRMVYLLLKDIRFMQKIPMDEFIAYQELLVLSDDVWHKAKEASDFALFQPYLEKIFETQKRFAHYAAPDKDPYDYWLNEYEPGLNKKTCDQFFDTFRARLVPLIKEITSAQQVDDSFMWGDFPEYKQDILSHYLMDLIGLDSEHVGLSVTEHPFTTSLGSHLDVRITTNYKKDNFAASMYSVIHEGGHALYDTGCARDLAYTVLDRGVSMGIHESQSRFYENLLGRSKGFTSYVLPKIRELFPEAMKDVTPDQFYKAINLSQPSLIRTEADEVTYCLHVMIRYELEKRVMAGELEVKDLPTEWNRLYKEYLGLDVPDDKRGVLQDFHWAGGLIGYFPSYALGSAYGAQFLHKMKETVDVDKCLADGNFAPINEWNRSHIWQYGSLYTPEQLLDRVFGEPFDPNYYMEYLENKYREIYGAGKYMEVNN